MWQINDPHEAKGYLLYWSDFVMKSGIALFKKFVNTVKADWSGITAYFDKRIINGGL